MCTLLLKCVESIYHTYHWCSIQGIIYGAGLQRPQCATQQSTVGVVGLRNREPLPFLVLLTKGSLSEPRAGIFTVGIFLLQLYSTWEADAYSHAGLSGGGWWSKLRCTLAYTANNLWPLSHLPSSVFKICLYVCVCIRVWKSDTTFRSLFSLLSLLMQGLVSAALYVTDRWTVSFQVTGLHVLSWVRSTERMDAHASHCSTWAGSRAELRS